MTASFGTPGTVSLRTRRSLLFRASPPPLSPRGSEMWGLRECGQSAEWNLCCADTGRLAAARTHYGQAKNSPLTLVVRDQHGACFGPQRSAYPLLYSILFINIRYSHPSRDVRLAMTQTPRSAESRHVWEAELVQLVVRQVPTVHGNVQPPPLKNFGYMGVGVSTLRTIGNGAALNPRQNCEIPLLRPEEGWCVVCHYCYTNRIHIFVKTLVFKCLYAYRDSRGANWWMAL
jgi:hypothetical protein